MIDLRKPARGEYRRRRKARKRRERKATIDMVRPAIFERAGADEYGAGALCECCKRRPATSMHETKPVSIGGKISTDNSIAVCGTGTTGCHGFLQQYKIRVLRDETTGVKRFQPMRAIARRWMEGEAA